MSFCVCVREAEGCIVAFKLISVYSERDCSFYRLLFQIRVA